MSVVVVSNPQVRENGSLDFLAFLHEVRGQYGMKSNRAGFFGKNPVFRFSGISGPNRPEIKVFQFFREIASVVLAVNGLKRSVLMVGSFWRKKFFREKSRLAQIWA